MQPVQVSQKKGSGDSGSHQGESQEIGTWHNPEGMWGSSSSSSDIIVDTQDKEAWPSISKSDQGASNGDTITNNSDSTKSTSVISSSSSNPGQTTLSQGQSDNNSSAVKSGSASNVWGATYNLGEAKMEPSTAAWVLNPSSFGQMNSGPWASGSHGSSNNVMQNPTSGDNTPLTSSAPVNQTLGWGIGTAGVGSNRPQDHVDSSKRNSGSGMPTSGAQTANDGQTLEGSTPSSMASAMSWPGLSFSNAGLPGLSKDQAANPQDTAWGNVSGNSVIGSGLGITTSAGPNSTTDSKSRMDQWGTAAGWGSSLPDLTPEATGWGSPTASPIPNAGTEGWGKPDNKPIPKAWTSGPNQYSKSNQSSSDWGQSLPDNRPNSTGWGQSSDAKQNPSPGWSDPNPKPTNPKEGWDVADSMSAQQKSVWGQVNDSRGPPPPSQWGGGAGAANPPPQWGGNNNGAGAAGGNPSGGENPSGAWGGNPSNARPSGPPPNSWGQPPAKDMSGHPSQPPSPSMSATVSQYPELSPKEQMVLDAINTTDSWGKRPIRQDQSWDNEAASPPSRRKSLSNEESNHWNQQNNNGTAIWESSMSSKDGPPQPSQWGGGDDRSRGASRGSGAEWGSDNDSGTWTGPPDHKSSNTWNNGPSQNQWGGGNQYQGNNQSNTWGSGNDRRDNQWGDRGNPNNQWGGPKRDDSHQWGASKDDNVWDKDGTNAWSQGGGGHRGGGGGGGGGMDSRSGMETGMWGDNRRRGSSSSWDEHEVGGWEDPSPPQSRRTPNMDDNPGYWGDSQPHRQVPWDRLQGPPNTSMPPPHMQNPMGRGVPGPRGPPPTDDKTPGMWVQSRPPSNKTGWGDPNSEIDKGTSIWGQGTQQVRVRHPKQVNPNWQDQSWPPGGAKPKPPPAAWGDPGDWAPKKMNPMPGANYGGKPPQPQMRSKMIQILTEMGFKREDAQNALISNNMNMESAIADLLNGANKRSDPDMDMEGQKARKLLGMPAGDITDPQSDANSIVPMSMPNTPFSNAQPQMSNSQGIGTPINKNTGMPGFSGLGGTSLSPNLNQKMQMPSGGMPPPQGQAIRGQMSSSAVQQQILHKNLIYQHLRMAVDSGLISPQLLTQQPSPIVQVLLRQLLQMQDAYQRLVCQQQVLQQKGSGTKPQLEQIALIIPKIKTQIYNLQQQIQVQQGMNNPAAAAAAGQGKPDVMKDISNNMTQLALTPQALLQQQSHAAAQPPQQQQPQPPQQQSQQQQQQQQHQQQTPQPQQSRLTQWKLPSPDREAQGGELNKAVGSRPLPQTHSAPNLQISKSEPGAPLPFPDNNTWSSSSVTTSDWPTSTASATSASSTTIISATTTSSVSSVKDSCSSSGSESGGENNSTKESPTTNTSSLTGVETSSASPTANDMTDNLSGSSNDAANINITDMIEEFVPGKKWTGLNQKSVEDDPYLTPASVTRPSLSVNTIKDDYVMNALGKSSSSPSMNSDSSTGSSLGSGPWSFMGSGSNGKNSGSAGKMQWSSAGDSQNSLTSDLWGMSAKTRPPPGISRIGGQSGFNRSVSWAPGDNRSSFMHSGGPPWGGGPAPSSCLRLKNLLPPIDGLTLRALCQQHGPLQLFYHNPTMGQALIRYSTKEEAMKAQKSLHSFTLGSTTIVAEFVSEADNGRLLEQLNTQGQPQGLPPTGAAPGSNTLSNLWPQTSQSPAPFNNYQRSTSHYAQGIHKMDPNQWNGATGFGGGSTWGNSGGLWGSGLEEHSLLQGDILGGQ